MLIMDGSERLQVKSATFTQDNAHGSRTVLELVNDRALSPGVPAAPGNTTDAPSTGSELPPSQPTDI
jgi:hypothetical protein